jgi:hypothetical protein
MDEQKRAENRVDESARKTTQPIATPITDPTNPHNQEPAGDWVANERAAERRNNEPGLTDHDRRQRRT